MEAADWLSRSSIHREGMRAQAVTEKNKQNPICFSLHFVIFAAVGVKGHERRSDERMSQCGWDEGGHPAEAGGRSWGIRTGRERNEDSARQVCELHAERRSGGEGRRRLTERRADG